LAGFSACFDAIGSIKVEERYHLSIVREERSPMHRRSLVVCLIAISAVACGGVEAQATGYFNLPGTHAQWAGHGFGAGYHAPLLLGPMRHDGPLLGNQVRLPYSPVPYYGCVGCGDCGRMIEEPTTMEGAVPTTAPAEMPPHTSTALPAPASEPVVEAPIPAPPEVAAPAVETTATPAIESPSEPPKPIFPAPVQ
jgi:hypothetical protein